MFASSLRSVAGRFAPASPGFASGGTFGGGFSKHWKNDSVVRDFDPIQSMEVVRIIRVRMIFIHEPYLAPLF